MKHLLILVSIILVSEFGVRTIEASQPDVDALRPKPRITQYPACTMDLFPTVADVLGLSEDAFVQPLDWISLKPVFFEEPTERSKPIPFRFGAKTAMIDNRYKLLSENADRDPFSLYDLETYPGETIDLSEELPQVFARMKTAWSEWNSTVDISFRGGDYPEGLVTPPDPQSIFWYESRDYAAFLPQWKDRWEFKSYLERRDQDQNQNKKVRR